MMTNDDIAIALIRLGFVLLSICLAVMLYVILWVFAHVFDLSMWMLSDEKLNWLGAGGFLSFCCGWVFYGLGRLIEDGEV